MRQDQSSWEQLEDKFLTLSWSQLLTGTIPSLHGLVAVLSLELCSGSLGQHCWVPAMTAGCSGMDVTSQRSRESPDTAAGPALWDHYACLKDAVPSCVSLSLAEGSLFLSRCTLSKCRGVLFLQGCKFSFSPASLQSSHCRSMSCSQPAALGIISMGDTSIQHCQ